MTIQNFKKYSPLPKPNSRDESNGSWSERTELQCFSRKSMNKRNKAFKWSNGSPLTHYLVPLLIAPAMVSANIFFKSNLSSKCFTFNSHSNPVK